MKDRKEPRYVLVDALRGIAALMVLLHHIIHNSVMEATLRHTLPTFILSLSDYGAYGVQIFFVLSGFVIAHSLRNNPLTKQAISNFVLRRQIRLDPPYWCTIAFVLLVHFAEWQVFPQTTPPLPTVKDVVLNIVYLQQFTGATPILLVAWTLCMEVQFYLVFILLLKVGQKTLTKWNRTLITKPTLWLVVISGIISMVFNLYSQDSPWFIEHWFYFAAGVLCCWAIKRQIRQSVFYAFMGVFAVSIVPSVLLGVGYRGYPPLLSGFVTLLLLYRAGQTGRLTTWGSNPVLQYFGRISYSLYLVHLTTSVVVLKLGYKLTGQNHLAALGWFCLSGLVSIGAAHLLHVGVEQPSMRFASQLKSASTLAVVSSPRVASTSDHVEASVVPVGEAGVG